MGDRRLRQNAVAKIKNERAGTERFEDGIGCAIENRSAGQKRKRIEIALDCSPRLNVITSKIEIDHPVETYGIDRDSVDIVPQPRGGAARKTDDACRRHSQSYCLDDARNWCDTPFVEFVGR